MARGASRHDHQTREGDVAARARDIEVRAADGLMLRGRWWRRAEPRGTLVIAHGFGEHGGTYRHVAEALGTRLDMDVVAVDFRGHGRSPGRRGVVRRYEDLTDDLACALEWAAQRRPDVPGSCWATPTAARSRCGSPWTGGARSTA